MRMAHTARRWIKPSPLLAAAGLVLMTAGVFQLGLVTVTVAAAQGAFSLRRRLTAAERLALLDELTSLGNRRMLLRDLEHEARVATPVRPVALVLLDLDGFKGYNDAHGHPAGDALLRQLAARLASALQGHGRAYRLGGDELCALLHCPREELEAHVRAATQALAAEGPTFRVTSSAGAVMLPDDAQDASSALRLADMRMYAVKRHRRGRRRDDPPVAAVLASEGTA
jgi:diguanylate cyclase (GGDEF)-like protein